VPSAGSCERCRNTDIRHIKSLRGAGSVHPSCLHSCRRIVARRSEGCIARADSNIVSLGGLEILKTPTPTPTPKIFITTAAAEERKLERASLDDAVRSFARAIAGFAVVQNHPFVYMGWKGFDTVSWTT